MLAEVGVEADQRRVPLGIEPLGAEVVNRQNRRVTGIAAPARETLAPSAPTASKPSPRRVTITVQLVGVDVPHAQQHRVTADPLLGGHIRRVGVPADIHLATQQRLHESLVVGIQQVVGRHLAAVEVLTKALPDRDDPG